MKFVGEFPTYEYRFQPWVENGLSVTGSAWPKRPMALEIARVLALLTIGAVAARARQLPDRHQALPFGAFLAPAIWLAFVWQRL